MVCVVTIKKVRSVGRVVVGCCEACFPCLQKLQLVLVTVIEEFASLYVSLGLSLLITAMCVHKVT